MIKKNQPAPLKIGKTARIFLDTFEYEVIRTNRKTLTLYVKQQRVIVRCPLATTNVEINEFIETNQNWILDRLKEDQIFQKETLKIEDNHKIFYQAKDRTIVFKEGRVGRVEVNRDEFIIQCKKIDPMSAKKQMEGYLIDKATEYIIPRAKGLAAHLGVGGKISEIKLRKTKSKWGHCTSKGVVQFNWLIMLAPNSIIDYIITHEVCHLIRMDHAPNFWELVESICPDYQKYVTWLKNHEHRLWFE